MTEERMRDAALAYMKQALGKECHCLDAVMVDEEWVARVVAAETKERRGATSGPKRWQVLYQVHLGLDGEPLYHVKKGLWEKDLPEVPAPPPAVAPVVLAETPETPPSAVAPVVLAETPETPPSAVAPGVLAETPETVPELELGAEPLTPVFAEQPATVDLSDIPITVGAGQDAATPEAGEETEPAPPEADAPAAEPETPLAGPEPVEPPTAAPAPGGQPLGERQGPPRLTFHYEASEGEETGS